jgi:hypothetical protein
MNVLDLDVYMNVLYIMCAMCRFCNSSCAGYTIFMYFLQHRLTYNGSTLIYVGPAQPS